jgi:AmmeMemoRadiSam system protein B
LFKETRPSPIAGRWYSGDPENLKMEILHYLNNAAIPDINDKVIGLFVPHAGYRYSGQTAAYAFKTIWQKHFDQVIILSPYHAYHPAKVITSSHKFYETPLGSVAIDQSSIQKLSEEINTNFPEKMATVTNDQEHSLEIQIPFLQIVLSGDFQLIPLMIRELTPKQSADLAEKIYLAIHPHSTLVVASTDLSHFYPQMIAEKLDSKMLDQIESFSIQGVYETEARGEGYACGLSAIMVSMALSRLMGANQVRKLNYATSAESSGDYSSVVGYGSGVFIKTDVSERKSKP